MLIVATAYGCCASSPRSQNPARDTPCALSPSQLNFCVCHGGHTVTAGTTVRDSESEYPGTGYPGVPAYPSRNTLLPPHCLNVPGTLRIFSATELGDATSES
eukprot:2805828-Rhodomonas_salina.5